MAGVFVSYSRGDRAIAERIVRALRTLDLDVWWDEDMPGVNWQRELERQINDLGAVLVIWTPLSKGSENVGDEARLGQKVSKLVNVLVGVAEPPFPFDRTNGLPLDGWDGREAHGGWTRVVQTLEEHLMQAGVAKRGELIGKLRAHEEVVRTDKHGLADAEEAFAAAKGADARASGAMTDAQAAFAAADEQFRRVVDMSAGAPILKAAQAQLDDARSGVEVARRAARDAEGRLADASRAMTRARAKLEETYGGPPPATPVADAPPASAPEPAARSQPAQPPPATPAPEVAAPPPRAAAPASAAPAAASGPRTSIFSPMSSILFKPRATWDGIDAQPPNPAALLFGYACVLALIAPASETLGAILSRSPSFIISSWVFRYPPIIIETLAVALAINLLARPFGGRASFRRALALVAYSCTPVWLAGVFFLLHPSIGWSRALVAVVVMNGPPVLATLYTAVLFCLGLPRLMKAPSPNWIGYAITVGLVTAAVQWVLNTLLNVLIFTGMRPY